MADSNQKPSNLKTESIIQQGDRFGAHNYHPLPVVLSEAKGVMIKDVEGKHYIDFLAAYSAVNQGHAHPRILDAMFRQAQKLSVCSRAFHNEIMPSFLQRLTSYTGYEKALPMNTGAEAVETAIKLARRWGHLEKGIPNGMQKIIVCENNFHGRTTTIISFSTDKNSQLGYGPYTPGFEIVPYGDALAIADAIDENTCAVLIEPIQGEAGVLIPPSGFLKDVKDICQQRQILFIADEIQTGFCRTGKRFAIDHEKVRADVLCLGKALGGGVFPVSAIVCDERYMNVFNPGSHGSTFGGNPLASAIAIAAMDVLDDEKLADRSQEMGELLREGLKEIHCKNLIEIRGKGLLNAIEFKTAFDAWPVCIDLMQNGLLAKQTHGNIIRFTPPLVINQDEMILALGILKKVLSNY